MSERPLRALEGSRIWMSGAISDADAGLDVGKQSAIIAKISRLIFQAGGTVIHGSHPTIWPILLQEAREFQSAGGSHDCLELAVSRYFSANAERNRIQIDDWQKHSIVHQIPAEAGSDARSASLSRLRQWIAERCDAVIVVGGRWWEQNPGGAGLPIEFELARPARSSVLSIGRAWEGQLRNT